MLHLFLPQQQAMLLGMKSHTLANALRFLSIDAVNAANSGHPGMPMGCADLVTALAQHALRFNPQDPNWLGRDRFILSNGHGSMLHYALLHMLGYDVALEDLKNFRSLNSKTPGHPEYAHTAGIETTTGPLGQGFANAVGMALAQKILAAKFGNELFGRNVYVVVGDGCLMEGISHEAAELAVHWGLDNLIVLFDDNAITIDGPTSLSTQTDQQARFNMYGFATQVVDGHDSDALAHTFANLSGTKEQPTFVSVKTQIGYGSPNKANSAAAHGSPLGEAERAATATALNWPHAPFEIPAEITAAWHAIATSKQADYQQWQTTYQNHPQKAEIEAFFAGDLNKEAHANLHAMAQELAQTDAIATRKAFGKCLEAMFEHIPQLLVGSADLTPSNNTQPKAAVALTAQDYTNRYLHYGIREHAMGAVMNGLSLSGFLPVGGTFLAFLDYMREPVRLAALMRTKGVFIFTHDSIGLGEDGPTHQPVEHLAMLRATPNLVTLRPADAVETAACLEIALTHNGPVALILSRQNLPTMPLKTGENEVKKGGYVVKKSENPQALLIATGSEVALALEAAEQLAQEDIAVNVISLPSWELFNQQDQAYQDDILPPHVTTRVAIEAASPLGWERWVGDKGKIIGMITFGASAPAEDLFTHFGFTAHNIVEKMKALLAS